jgi:hypothetical protein
MRLIIIAILVYLLYRAFRSWIAKNVPKSGPSVTDRDAVAIDDVMVKDPYCNVYFPKRKGVPLEENGEELLFCSAECRNKYLAARDSNDNLNQEDDTQ